MIFIAKGLVESTSRCGMKRSIHAFNRLRATVVFAMDPHTE
jgi:hypothetical protein